MKEASGELSMTVITIIAVALILGLLYLMWPTIQERIQDTFDNATTDNSANLVQDNNQWN